MRSAYDSFREEKYMTAIKPKFDIEKLNLHYGAFHASTEIYTYRGVQADNVFVCT